ncbi:hypothetical protein MKC78_06175 [[Clostridium] innocuum]|nr:hypothetical protein [[Clostridium] innocuum]
MNDMIKKDNLNEFGLYESIRNVLIQARKKNYQSVNSSIVMSYWSIGKLIVENE